MQTLKRASNDHEVFGNSRGVGRCSGTFGELLQGVDMNNEDFLVTFPVNRFSTVRYMPFNEDLLVYPVHKQKSRRLAEMILEHYHKPIRGIIEISSDLPEGKGLASSSADLVATARAIQSYFDLPMSNEVLECFLAKIEPTDGVMYSGITAFYHKQVKLNQILGHLPSLTVMSIDEGGEVDTVIFNQCKKKFSDHERHAYQTLLQLMIESVAAQDLLTIGSISTQSAMLNQRFIEKKTFSDLSNINREIGGLGIITAHSGTSIGILLNPSEDQYEFKLYQAHKCMQQIGEPMIFHSLSQGEG